MNVIEKIDAYLTGSGFGPGGSPKRGSVKSGKSVKMYCDNDRCSKETSHIEDQFGYTCTKCGQQTMKTNEDKKPTYMMRCTSSSCKGAQQPHTEVEFKNGYTDRCSNCGKYTSFYRGKIRDKSRFETDKK